MSLDRDSSPPPSFSRDWFFPSPSFIHQSPPKTHKYRRRFSTTPRISHQNPPDSNLPKTSSFAPPVSSSTTTSYRDPKYARLRRRRVEFPRRSENSSKQEQEDAAILGERTSSGERTVWFSGHRNRVRWQMAISAAIVISCLASLVHKNFSLHNQVIDLQDQISKLNFRLRACNLLSQVDNVESIPLEIDDQHRNGLKRLAFVFSLTLLSIPVLVFKYVDFVSKSRSSDNISEEVSLNKQIEYRVDVFLSVHPYAKPLALLVATLLLICLGGLALFGVTDDGLADSLWLSWTYVADSGNHANSEGVGPRLVSVSISFGGMLIFAMMLGLVSDAISEKFDSLRKGRSEVVEQNHTLILGWSDKLGSLLNQLAIANESLGGGIVVVMAERDKEEMEMDIAKMEFDFKGTKVICRSGSPLILADLKKVNEASFIHIARPARKPQKILLCGWRRDIDDMIVVLDAFLAPGSELWMFNDVPENEREKKLIDGGLDINRLVNISLVNREGNAVIRRHLESLPLESFDSILILADESVEDSAIQADSRSLATLLLIRDIQAKRLPYREAMVTQVHRGSFSQGSWIGEMQQASDKSVIISEILDPRTKNLLSMSRISDYVLSNELVSMALAMVAEDKQINDVLEELFAEEGNEMHIRQADLYLREGEELSFYEIILRARQRREIVIGYRLANAERAVINPPAKSERRRWSLKDVFVVIAEKE
ncbi:ion channel CASTOR isoform X5 [Hevea brasiliensis]|uniref:ion channel CASTOR isoform X5 n=1 Tax=Hevea brasiliensis TaxID=3981 RepID=UPI000B76CE68|nr:ion channel CASTOR isoform X5 [Hevea brasiliensis]